MKDNRFKLIEKSAHKIVAWLFILLGLAIPIIAISYGFKAWYKKDIMGVAFLFGVASLPVSVALSKILGRNPS